MSVQELVASSTTYERFIQVYVETKAEFSHIFSSTQGYEMSPDSEDAC